MSNNLEKILAEPSYWIEGVNGDLYNAIIEYMEENNLTKTETAKVLGMSKGRLSQILNCRNSNFTIKKLIEISIKVGKYPVFELNDKKSYINQLNKNKGVVLKIYHLNEYSLVEGSKKQETLTYKENTKLKIA